MSTTALVRSSSSSNSLVRSPSASGSLVRSSSSNNNLVPSTSQPKPVTPSTTSTTTQPNLNLTPQRSTPTQQPSPAYSTPGRWQHPRMDEISRRQSRTNFDNGNMRVILYNVGFMLLSFLAPSTVDKILPTSWTTSLHPYDTFILLLFRLFFISNTAIALTPLFHDADACYDIPLDPAQRQLLGLPPMSRPATPQEKEQWVTPPRYSRSATPRSSSSSLRPEISGSPLSGRGTPYSPSGGSPYGNSTAQQGRRSSGSPLTPTGARGGPGAERRRLSYNNQSSPLHISESDAAGSINTPTKTNKRASVGLNSKWLYEKGRASPVGLMGSGWGSGSVFS